MTTGLSERSDRRSNEGRGRRVPSGRARRIAALWTTGRGREPVVVPPHWPSQHSQQEFADMTDIRKGTEVEWKYGSSKAEGKVEQKFTKEVTRKIKGKEVTRKATNDNPAYLVKQDDGTKVLKSGSELHKA
jgi:hypothetical protein